MVLVTYEVFGTISISAEVEILTDSTEVIIEDTAKAAVATLLGVDPSLIAVIVKVSKPQMRIEIRYIVALPTLATAQDAQSTLKDTVSVTVAITELFAKSGVVVEVAGVTVADEVTQRVEYVNTATSSSGAPMDVVVVVGAVTGSVVVMLATALAARRHHKRRRPLYTGDALPSATGDGVIRSGFQIPRLIAEATWAEDKEARDSTRALELDAEDQFATQD